MGWRDPAFRKAQRAARIAARICVQCRAGLQETDGAYCVECEESRRMAVERFELRNPGRRRSGARDPQKSNARRRGEYAKRKTTESCLQSGCPDRADVENGRDRCPKHYAMSRKASRDHQRRKALRPVTVLFRAIAAVACYITSVAEREHHRG